MLFPHPVVSPMEGDAMVVDDPSGINCPFEVSIPVVFIQLELQCLHAVYYYMFIDIVQ